jgi:RsiW-degrading membrane proteinase PrsW (M82 family)
MQLTYKNSNQIIFGIAIIICIIWIILGYTIIVGSILIATFIIFIAWWFYKDKPRKPTKFEVIGAYICGIISLILCLLFNSIAYLFIPLIFLSMAIVHHVLFIALKNRGVRKNINNTS